MLYHTGKIHEFQRVPGFIRRGCPFSIYPFSGQKRYRISVAGKHFIRFPIYPGGLTWMGPQFGYVNLRQPRFRCFTPYYANYKRKRQLSCCLHYSQLAHTSVVDNTIHTKSPSFIHANIYERFLCLPQVYDICCKKALMCFKKYIYNTEKQTSQCTVFCENE